MIERNYVIDQLDYIDPDDYDTWMRVGAALKHEGFPCSTWEEWSRRSDKHRPGECERKWQSFREENAGAPVTGGTIWHEAEANGWRPPSGEMYEGMVVCSELACPEPDRRATEKIIDPSFARESVPPPPPDYDPVADALRYLDELFEPDEYVGFCTRGAYGGGKPYPSPTDQIYGITVANVARTLRSSGDKFVHDDDAGAWIRFNPLDGVGCGNSNVTRYTYALVESDEDEVEKQYAILQQLNLPIKVLVHSGNKSLHAIVRIPVYFMDSKEMVPVEVQIRTIAMDYWASLEHDLKYKAIAETRGLDIAGELKECSSIIEDIENKMQVLADALDSGQVKSNKLTH